MVRSGPTVAGLRGVIPHVCAAYDGPSRLRSLLSLSAIGACHVLRGEGDLCAFLVPVAAAVSPSVPLQAAPPGPGTTRVWGVAMLRPLRAWFRTAQVQVQGKAWTACRRRANLRLSRFPGPRPRRRELLAFGRSPAATRERLGHGGCIPSSGWCDICH